MKKKLKYVLLVFAAGAVFLMVYTYVGFSRKGLNTWFAGQTTEDHYPNWDDGAVDVYEADRSILNKDHLFFSKTYILKDCATDNYQLRFRFAYSIPFMRGDSLLQDTDWLKLTDSDGNDYQNCLTVYSSKVTGLNCINATLTMDGDTFSALSLSGDKLTVSVVCAEGGLNAENSYAGGEVEIQIPEID